jgi:diphthine synthase
MLTFIGLGLYDADDISEKGLRCIRNADHIYLEIYTSRLMGTSYQELEVHYGKSVHLLRREDVEQHPDELLDRAETNRVVFSGGDPMVSTTHTDLRMRAAARGIRTSIIHGASISSAVCGLTGLQNYRFGKSCSIPFPHNNWFPTTPIDVIALNQSLRLHTLVYLDIQDERYMTVHEAIDLIQQMAAEKRCIFPYIVLHGRVSRSGEGRNCRYPEIDQFRFTPAYADRPGGTA